MAKGRRKKKRGVKRRAASNRVPLDVLEYRVAKLSNIIKSRGGNYLIARPGHAMPRRIRKKR